MKTNIKILVGITIIIAGLSSNLTTYAIYSIGIFYDNQKEFVNNKTNKQFTCGETVSDIDGNTYNTVQIGNQCWFAENLKVKHYNDGSAIQEVLDDNKWINTSEGAYVIYPHQGIDGLNSKEEVIEAYGALYNWYAVDDQRGLCPVGWKVPNDDDWQTLKDFVDNDGFEGISGIALRSCRQVNSPQGENCNTNEHPRWSEEYTNPGWDIYYGTDNYGFSALPGGDRMFHEDNIYNSGISVLGLIAGWWSSDNPGMFWEIPIFRKTLRHMFATYQIARGHSIRCIKE